MQHEPAPSVSLSGAPRSRYGNRAAKPRAAGVLRERGGFAQHADLHDDLFARFGQTLRAICRAKAFTMAFLVMRWQSGTLNRPLFADSPSHVCLRPGEGIPYMERLDASNSS
jgi:hypothetical protein